MIDALLQQYQNLLSEVDKACKKSSKACPKIPCHRGCPDCCKQLFPLSLIEAFYISEGLKSLDRKTRREIQRKAEKGLAKIKELNLEQYEISSDSLDDIAQARNSITTSLQSDKEECPLLKDGLCSLYDYRNHDCRIHGVSFDSSTGEIIGCFRHPKIFTSPELKKEFAEKAVPSNFLYKEKSKLDSLITEELSKDPNQKYTYYFTHPFKPLLENFREFDWQQFFEEKTSTQTAQPSHKYSLIIHI